MRRCIAALVAIMVVGSEAFIGKDSCKEMTCTHGVNNLPKAKVWRPLSLLCPDMKQTIFATYGHGDGQNAALTPTRHAVEGKLGEHQVPGVV